MHSFVKGIHKLTRNYELEQGAQFHIKLLYEIVLIKHIIHQTLQLSLDSSVVFHAKTCQSYTILNVI